MKYNASMDRWELWWFDSNFKPILIGWVAGEVPEEARGYWYRQQLERLLG